MPVWHSQPDNLPLPVPPRPLTTSALTLCSHTASIARKLGAHSRPQAVPPEMRHGLVWRLGPKATPKGPVTLVQAHHESAASGRTIDPAWGA